LSELLQLYSYWCDKNKVTTSITEEMILSLLKHFYTSIVIKQNKYILGCKSTMWNKEQDISNFFTSTTYNLNFQVSYNNDLYQLYCNYIKNNKINFTTSKSYFKSYFKIYREQNT